MNNDRGDNHAGSEEPRAEGPESERRVLLLAPTERDTEASRAVLGAAGIACTRCDHLELLCEEIQAGAGAVIVPEEIVLADGPERLAQAIRCQPVWSDLPVIVLSRTGMESPAVRKAMATLGNVSLIERPVRVTTLLSVVRTALRAREKQYQVRDHLEARERTEQQLRDAKAEAEEANRSKDQFLAALSHELRTPLSPVVMTIGSWLADKTIPAHFREEIEMVRRNVDLETKLIDDLLDVSRAASGKLRLRIETVNIHRVLDHVLTVCESDRFAKRLGVVTDYRATSDAVRGDAGRLHQVFWNVLKNAIKFSEEGGEIRVSTQDAGPGRVRVLVSDNGIGIPADVLPRLFNAFEQGDSGVTRRFGGLGLGLAISKAVVDLHGGSIHAESEGHEKGATFVVELNTTQMSMEAPSTPAQSGRESRQMRILLVEDHSDTATTLSRLLVASGHSVRTARTVEGALRLAKQESFDLLLSDIGLPDATGYDLMRQVSSTHRLPGIAMSGYGMDDDIRKSREAGFSEHLVKPITYTQLEQALRNLPR